MSFSSLSTELRLEIYSYLVFDAPEPPSEPPIICIAHHRNFYVDPQLVPNPVFNRLCHRSCKKLASPQEMHRHFLNDQIDPLQTRGSMLVEYGTNRPYLSTPRCKIEKENVDHLTWKDFWKTRIDPTRFKIDRVHPLLLTSRWLADDIRTWVYRLFTFDFGFYSRPAFNAFTENLQPQTMHHICALRLSFPIYSHYELDMGRMQSDLQSILKNPRSEDRIINEGFAWRASIPRNVQKAFPNLHTLHINLWHYSRQPTVGTRLAAPIGDLPWREEALEPLLRFRVLSLKEVTVVVENVWPNTDVWSGDPKIKERRELAQWLKTRLLEG